MQIPRRRPAPAASPAEIFRSVYWLHCQLLQSKLESLPLPGALEAHLAYHRMLGFIKDDLALVERFQFASPEGLILRAEFNPRRLLRHNGAGRNTPPEGFDSVHDGCFLAPENIMWQQCGMQLPHCRDYAGLTYAFLTQPFPFGPMHFTVPVWERAPQDWRPSPAALDQRIRAMHAIVSELPPGYAVLYNGSGAGSSIDWYHFHLLKPGRLPIQDAAHAGARWPLDYQRADGSADRIVASVLAAADAWQQRAGADATECIAMVWEDGAVACYYIPRGRSREYAAPERFRGRVGAAECAGVFIFEQEEEGRALREGQIGFANLWSILEDVRPEGRAR